MFIYGYGRSSKNLNMCVTLQKGPRQTVQTQIRLQSGLSLFAILSKYCIKDLVIPKFKWEKNVLILENLLYIVVCVLYMYLQHQKMKISEAG